MRGCGERKPGLYAVCGMSPYGKPMDYFLFCPPQPIPYGIVAPNLGCVIAEYDGYYHIFNRIGLSGYPNVADWIEETRTKGSSLRISPTLPLHLLTPGKSGQFFIHDKAIIENWQAYGEPLWEGWGGYGNRLKYGECPRGEHQFPPRESHCLTMSWEDVDGGIHDENKHPRAVVRTVGDLEYTAYCRPEGVAPKYTQAMIAWLPVGRICVFEGAGEEENKTNWDVAKKSGFAVEQIWE